MRGFDAATLREITELAQANTAAVNYHFRSKEELFRQVFEATAAPVNEALLAALDKVVSSAGEGPPDLDEIIFALVRPMVEVTLREDGERPLIGLLLQVRASLGEAPSKLISRQYDEVMASFIKALHSALPELTRKDIVWRYRFAAGAILQILSDTEPARNRLKQTSCGVLSMADCDPDTVASQLAAFLSAGFRASSVKVTGAKRRKKVLKSAA